MTYSINKVKDLVISLESRLSNVSDKTPKAERDAVRGILKNISAEALKLNGEIYRMSKVIPSTPPPVDSVTPPKSSTQSPPLTQNPPQPTNNPPVSTPSPVGDSGLYNDTQSQLHQWLKANPNHPQYQLLKTKIADVPKAVWLGDWSDDLDRQVKEAREQNKTAVFILYNSIKRDLGSYSAGGAANIEKYLQWIDKFVTRVGDLKCFVMMEPDALPHMANMSVDDVKLRQQMLQQGLQRLRKNKNARVYLDAGHSNWLSADETARLLKVIGVELFDGFALNVSNRRPTDELIRFGKEVSGKVGGKHFIIDTSRNGVAQSEWLNPTGEKLGRLPTFNTGEALCDAFLWLKSPGESDGEGNGGPPAGKLWIERALQLAVSN